jgi:hypothetical protein
MGIEKSECQHGGQDGIQADHANVWKGKQLEMFDVGRTVPLHYAATGAQRRFNIATRNRSLEE